ncbi:MAG: cytochrome P460 family protein [Acidobacteria bacterium]|nr:cytochrome P460 family protein [Acidobacteriota bacterium]
MRKYKIFAIICSLTLFLTITFTNNSTNIAQAKIEDPELTELRAIEQKLAPKAARQNMIPPIKKKKMVAWLKAGLYKELFTAEPTIHGSTGPHGGNVRTFYNPILTENLRAGKKTWDVGAAMVKELYLSSTNQVSGYAVMIKVDEESGADGSGWIYFESFSGSADNAFYGKGVQLCANCHRGGVDFLLATFRP